MTEQEFEFDNINAFEYAMERRLAGRATFVETKFREPVTRIVMPPIRDGRLRGAAAHHSDAGEQKYRQQIISFTFGLSEVRE
jgi:hypothetical protein